MNISLAAEPLFQIGSFPVTNSLLVSWVVVLFMVVIGSRVARSSAAVPGRLQNAVEAMLEAMLNFADNVTGDRRKTLKFFPLVASIFFFVLLANWIGLLPGAGSVGIFEVHEGEKILLPFLRAASADLNFTLALALVSVGAAQIYGMRALGTLVYWKKFFVPPWREPYGIGTFVGLLELVSELAKVISFSFRLFGNIFAGEVLLLVMGTLLPYLAPIPFLFMEIFVGLVQAMVFALLTLVFLTIATESHGSHEAEPGDRISHGDPISKPQTA
ncbi:ATP synthase F0 subunit A [Patescibacteria group bacterium]|nr:MAG: ATP synthase F0 subunit A [Patescibacteria group bacterium]